MSWHILLYDRTHGDCKLTVINLLVLSKGALSVFPSEWLVPYYEILDSEEVAKAAHKKTDPKKTDPPSLFIHSCYSSAFIIVLKLLLILRLSSESDFHLWGRAVCCNKSKNVQIMWSEYRARNLTVKVLFNPFWSYIGPRPTVWFSSSAPMSEDVRRGFCCVCSPAVGACPTICSCSTDFSQQIAQVVLFCFYMFFSFKSVG
jgi:hypothetical protein